MIKLNFYVQSNNWPRRINKVKKITNKVIKEKTNLNFDKNINYYLNIILLNNKKIKKLMVKIYPVRTIKLRKNKKIMIT